MLSRVATFLLGDANVGVDEGGAGRFELHGRGRRQRDVRDVRHCDPEITLRALFEKRTGAGGAGVVHRIVNRHAVAQVDVLCILPADLENRVNVGIEVVRPGRLRGNFVEDMLRAEIGADQFPGRTGGGNKHTRRLPT